METITNIPELDFNILLNLDLKSLGNACNSSKYLNDICEDFYFWKRKFDNEGLIIINHNFNDVNIWIQEYIIIKNLTLTSRKILIVNEIEATRGGDDNTDGSILIDIKDQEISLWKEILPLVTYKKMISNISLIIPYDYNVSVYIIYIDGKYELSTTVYNLYNDDEFPDTKFIEYNDVIKILVKSLYYNVRISDLSFDNGIDFIVDEIIPDNYTDIEKAHYLRRMGIWDSLNYFYLNK